MVAIGTDTIRNLFKRFTTTGKTPTREEVVEGLAERTGILASMRDLTASQNEIVARDVEMATAQAAAGDEEAALARLRASQAFQAQIQTEPLGGDGLLGDFIDWFKI